jgi:hypothetical protein
MSRFSKIPAWNIGKLMHMAQMKHKSKNLIVNKFEKQMFLFIGRSSARILCQRNLDQLTYPPSY